MDEMFEPIVLGSTDRLVETAMPGCRGNHVPQADASSGETFQSLVVRKRLEILVQRGADQSPELIQGMRIVAPRRQ